MATLVNCDPWVCGKMPINITRWPAISSSSFVKRSKDELPLQIGNSEILAKIFGRKTVAPSSLFQGQDPTYKPSFKYFSWKKYFALSRIWTRDLPITKQPCYWLSYTAKLNNEHQSWGIYTQYAILDYSLLVFLYNTKNSVLRLFQSCLSLSRPVPKKNKSVPEGQFSQKIVKGRVIQRFLPFTKIQWKHSHLG